MEKGLKTGMYYLRTQAASQAVKFTVENQAGKNMEPVIPEHIEQSAEEIAEYLYLLNGGRLHQLFRLIIQIDISIKE